MSTDEAETCAAENPWDMVRRRLIRPLGQSAFFLVLGLGIVVLGYLSVWIEAWQAWRFTPTQTTPNVDLEPLKLAYATAILAVGAPSCMQIMLTQNKMAIVVSIAAISGVLALAYILSTSNLLHPYVHLVGGAGFLLTIFSWWLANGEDDLFQDRINPYAASGGYDTSRPLPGGKRKVRT